MIQIKPHNKQHLLAFSAIAALLLCILVYASHTGWRIFNSDGDKQGWNSSGPGYHK
jgi:hypothetical protein